MQWTEAIEVVIGRTRHETYRRLCSDEHPDHAIHRQRMIEKAAGLAHAAPAAEDARQQPAVAARDVAEAVALTRAVRSCQFRSTDIACGCNGGRCALRGGEVVSHIDCFACIRRYG